MDKSECSVCWLAARCLTLATKYRDADIGLCCQCRQPYILVKTNPAKMFSELRPINIRALPPCCDKKGLEKWAKSVTKIGTAWDISMNSCAKCRKGTIMEVREDEPYY